MKIRFEKNRTTRIDGFKYVLDRQHEVTEGEMEVMITQVVEHRQMRDQKPLPLHESLMFIVTPVDNEKYLLVKHKGFECAGSMARTLASVDWDYKAQGYASLRPGRMQHALYVADNLNSQFYKSPPMPLIEGAAWIERKDIERKATPFLVHGVEDITQMSLWITRNDPRVAKWRAAHDVWERERDARIEANRRARGEA